MEKNRIRPVTSGKSMRMSYSRQKEVLQMPNPVSYTHLRVNCSPRKRATDSVIFCETPELTRR